MGALANVCRYTIGWDGVPFEGSHAFPVAVDTETDTVPDNATIPTLALLSASDGTRTTLVHPDQVGDFLAVHSEVPFVFHNSAFDFWVIHQHLKTHPSRAYSPTHWWDRVDRHLVHDTMLLDALVRLARGEGEYKEDAKDDKFHTRNLGLVAQEYAGLHIDKKDQFRRRYGELIGRPWYRPEEALQIEPGFFQYAAKDAHATALIYPPLREEALKYVRKCREFMPKGAPEDDPCRRWGILTEQIQIKGAIALAQISRNGLHYDAERAELKYRELKARGEHLARQMEELCPGILTRHKGRWVIPKNSEAKLPQMDQKILRQRLEQAVYQIRQQYPDFETPFSSGKMGGISTSADDWKDVSDADPFLKAWVEFKAVSKRLSFLGPLCPEVENLFSCLPREIPTVRCRYTPLLRTGRTSASDPNLQQQPRDRDFRSLFIPRPGYKFFTADYAFIELRTFAVTCLARLGRSVLAQVIAQGKDPHSYTASLLAGVSYEQIGKKSEERQNSKIANFGLLGGMAAPALMRLANHQYKQNWDLAYAEFIRDKILNEVYPEMNPEDGYLSDSFFADLAANVGLTRREVLHLFGITPKTAWLGRVIPKLLQGSRTKKNGEPYDTNFFNRCWDKIQALGKIAPLDGPLSEESRQKLLARSGDPKLWRELASGHAVTITGRIRGRVNYTKEKNTPFQGLAADGAKLALYRLIKEKYWVVGFVHDEIMTELPEKTAQTEAVKVRQIMEEEMEKVLSGPWGHVPAEAEGVLGDCWQKG